jgi:glucose-6-phosphate 1-dehydrogenase
MEAGLIKNEERTIVDSDHLVRSRESKLDPLTIIIYGATGDLTWRKLIPALYELYSLGSLPAPFRIVGTGRSELGDQQWRDRLREGMELAGDHDLSRWQDFAGALSYIQAHPDAPEQFDNLARTVRRMNGEADTGANLLHYFALPPSMYEPVADAIARCGLAHEHHEGVGWSRLVVEKPFGRDLRSAQRLNRRLLSDFAEHQIFRIDHYLAKETVQNVLAFRLANTIFEPLWNRHHVDHVRIIAAETLGVEQRAGYYEEAGVLRDMLQNHMMQLLAVTAIEPPARWESERVRDERAKLFRSLQPLPEDLDVFDSITLGQYGEGEVDGRRVPAYRDEPGVARDSLTPTYARMKVFIDNWRWQGVPFYLTSGKRLDRKVSEAVIQFKEVPNSMFRGIAGDSMAANSLTLGFQPEEVISVDFLTKTPGPRLRLRPASLSFDYSAGDEESRIDAYAKVLLDCMAGDHMLFWRQDGIEESWRFLEPILSRCESCAEREDNLHFYPAGSAGPQRGLDMMPSGRG